jgi:hypothetical protein
VISFRIEPRDAAAVHRVRTRVGIAALLALALVLPFGCGGDDGGGGVVPTNLVASVVPSGTAAAPNLVRLRASSVSGDTAVLEVVLGGPTTSSDVYAFAFDLVLSNPAIAAYVAGSAAAGTALVPTGGQSITVQAVQTGNRVVVGITKVGGGAGNGVGAAEPAIVRLSFRVLAAGATQVTFSGSVAPQNPTGAPAALDSNVAIVPTIAFDGVAAAISASY